MFITNLHIFPFDIDIGAENVYQYHYFVYMKQNKKSNENIEVLFLIYRPIGKYYYRTHVTTLLLFTIN